MAPMWHQNGGNWITSLKVIRYIYVARVGSSRVLGCLISGHLRFQVVRARIGSDFRLFDLGSSQVSGRSSPDRVGFQIVWSWVISDFGPLGFGSDRVSDFLMSDHFEFQVRVKLDSNQFDFLKKSDWIRFESEWVGQISRIGSGFATNQWE
jgi:hypothetical protein